MLVGRHVMCPGVLLPSITGRDLMAWVHGSTAGTRILLLDTCQAGAAANRGISLALTADDDEQARESGRGLYILGASSSEGYAKEAEGHGLFTQALLSGLDGAADSESTGNDDGLVDMNELVSYLIGKVKELSKNEQEAAMVDIESDIPPVVSTAKPKSSQD